MSNEIRKKVKSKEEIGKPSMESLDLFGGGLRIPNYIQKELDEQGLVGRFVSMAQLTKTGGHHPRGWTVYTIKEPQVNPITGTPDKTYKYGDLILAVKPKSAHAEHKKYLDKLSTAQQESHKKSVKEIRDRIREGRGDKHISLIDGYEENDGEE